MSPTAAVTDSFSVQRRKMLEDFANVSMTANSEKVSGLWSQYHDMLTEARGVFCVDASKYGKPDLPGNRDFGGRGFLRSWMASNRLLLIQNRDGAKECRYSAPIFCDSNFVSYCEAFHSGRSLGPNEAAFREAVVYLLPIAEGTNAFPYLVENAENPDFEKVRSTLQAFAAFKLTSPAYFKKHGQFVTSDEDPNPNEIADGSLKIVHGQDFKILYARLKEHYLWSRIVLIKATLLFFDGRLSTVATLFYSLLKFLHDELARFPQFEIYAAHRFFQLNSREPFFSPVQQNARNLDQKIRSMAWDMAHWRSLFEMLAIGSSFVGATPFPIPHFLSFDRRFVRLTESCQLNGLIYAADGRRCEHIYSESLLRPVSELLAGPCCEFYTEEAMRDRQRRNLVDEVQTEMLIQTEVDLTKQLNSTVNQILQTDSAGIKIGTSNGRH